MAANNSKRVILYGICPECQDRIQVGTLRCQKGHWLYWKGTEEAGFVAEIRKQPMTWPRSGRINFRGEKRLSSRETPEKKAKKSQDFSPSQWVTVTEECDGMYHLTVLGLEAGWLEHQYVVITIDVTKPKKAFVSMKGTIIREGGATIWLDEKLTTRGSMLKKGTEVTIVGETRIAWKLPNGYVNKSVVSVKK